MSSILAIAAASAAAVDSVHEERFQLVPMLSHQHGGGQPDPARPEAELTAPFILGSGLDALDTKGRTDTRNIGNGPATLYVLRDKWPMETGLKKGDVVIALDRPGSPRFAVDHVDMRPMARIIVHLSGLGHA